jgi:hypothetical protein
MIMVLRSEQLIIPIQQVVKHLKALAEEPHSHGLYI